VYPTLRSMLVLMDVFRAKKEKRRWSQRSAPKFPQRKYASFCMSEKCCECPQTSSPKRFHPERRENNNQVMSDRGAM
jgi:hypothetical protein